jgi:hypothetical protein
MARREVRPGVWVEDGTDETSRRNVHASTTPAAAYMHEQLNIAVEFASRHSYGTLIGFDMLGDGEVVFQFQRGRVVAPLPPNARRQ